MNDIDISIITLKKNDEKKFNRTVESVISQKKDFQIEWIIVDGSDAKMQKNKKKTN